MQREERYPVHGYRHSQLERYRDVLRRDPCSYCGQVPAGTVDHIEARFPHGGPHSWENLTASCSTCNRKKGSLDLLTFLQRRNHLRVVPRRAGPLTFTIGELMRR